MAVKKVLERLLRLRELEEEQSRLTLESAVEDRNRIDRELSDAADRQAQGRRTFVAGMSAPDSVGRCGGVMEMEQARRLRQQIAPRLKAAEDEMTRQRDDFLARRTARRQVETLVDEEQQAGRESEARRAQQMLDDWYGRRRPKRILRSADEGSDHTRSTESSSV
jgi:flagellar export protein FliJ